MIDNFLGIPVAKIGGFPYGEWCTESPTESGQYWFVYMSIRNGTEMPLIGCQEVVIDSDGPHFEFNVSRMDCDPDYRIEDVTHWLGPLPAPEMPR